MGGTVKSQNFGDQELERHLREVLQSSSDAYKKGENPKTRLEAIFTYAQARKDLSEFLGEEVA